MNQNAQHAPQRAERNILLDLITVIAVVGAGWMIVKIVIAPSTEEAMRQSLAELNVPELSTAYALHSDTCAITKEVWKWRVACEGVPVNFYRDAMQCDPGPPRACHTVDSDHQVCVSYYWDIDLKGSPSNPLGDRGRYASVGDKCGFSRSFSAEREEIAKRGIVPNLVEIQ